MTLVRTDSRERRLRVSDDALGSEFTADAPDRSVERSICVTGAVCTSSTHFQGVAAVVEESGHRTAHDGDADQFVGALDPDADRQLVPDRTAVVTVVQFNECLCMAQRDDLRGQSWTADAHWAG